MDNLPASPYRNRTDSNRSLISLSGFSGVGKSYMIDFMVRNHHYEHCPYITTRKPRGDEKQGIDRIFCTETEFLERKDFHNILCQSALAIGMGLILEH